MVPRPVHPFSVKNHGATQNVGAESQPTAGGLLSTFETPRMADSVPRTPRLPVIGGPPSRFSTISGVYIFVIFIFLYDILSYLFICFIIYYNFFISGFQAT